MQLENGGLVANMRLGSRAFSPVFGVRPAVAAVDPIDANRTVVSLTVLRTSP
jgi:hypothetical protein